MGFKQACELTSLNGGTFREYGRFRGHLARALDEVNEDQAPLLDTRQGGKPAVVMSLEDYESYEEMAYLMASPANAERLNRAIEEIEAGHAQAHELVEPCSCPGRVQPGKITPTGRITTASKVKRINALLKAIQRDPFVGPGKPEPLRHERTGYWSRRIDREHRLVHKVRESGLFVAQCRYRYQRK